jgi:hypothetical protein
MLRYKNVFYKEFILAMSPVYNYIPLCTHGEVQPRHLPAPDCHFIFSLPSTRPNIKTELKKRAFCVQRFPDRVSNCKTKHHFVNLS